MRPVLFILMTISLLLSSCMNTQLSVTETAASANVPATPSATTMPPVSDAEGILHVGGTGELVLHTAESGGGSVNTNQLKEKGLARIAATGSVLSVEDKGTGILKE